MKPEHHLSRHLLQILGEEAFVRLCQELGGTRVYVPYKCREGSDLVDAIGAAACEKLSLALAPATIRVPLARRERALFYRGQGLSNPRIACKLGITETGLQKLFAREADLPDRGEKTMSSQIEFALDESGNLPR
ncbi:MAG: hypothetical protein WBA68_10165 [Alteraurantiacibacter sp.]